MSKFCSAGLRIDDFVLAASAAIFDRFASIVDASCLYSGKSSVQILRKEASLQHRLWFGVWRQGRFVMLTQGHFPFDYGVPRYHTLEAPAGLSSTLRGAPKDGGRQAKKSQG